MPARFYKNQIVFPQLPPLLQPFGAWEVREDDYEEVPTTPFLLLHNMGDGEVRVDPSDALLPTEWSLYHEPSNLLAPFRIEEGMASGEFAGQKNTVEFGIGTLRYKGLRQVALGRGSYRLGLNVMRQTIGEHVIIKCRWTFDDGRPIGRDHGPLWIAFHWCQLKQRVERARRYFVGPLRYLASEEAKLIEKVLRKLESVELGKSLPRVEKVEGPNFVDLDRYEECVSAILPPVLRPSMHNASLLPDLIFTQQYSISATVQGNELTAASCSVATQQNLPNRRQLGVAFLTDHLGFIPEIAQQNTRGRKMRHEFELDRSMHELTGLALDFAQAGSALAVYAELVLPGIQALRPHLTKFLSTDWEHGLITPPT